MFVVVQSDNKNQKTTAFSAKMKYQIGFLRYLISSTDVVMCKQQHLLNTFKNKRLALSNNQILITV
jgi:hypothetical protein